VIRLSDRPDERRASGPAFSFAYAARAAFLRNPRRLMSPSPANPASIMAQVEGSGAAFWAENSKAWVKPFT